MTLLFIVLYVILIHDSAFLNKFLYLLPSMDRLLEFNPNVREMLFIRRVCFHCDSPGIIEHTSFSVAATWVSLCTSNAVTFSSDNLPLSSQSGHPCAFKQPITRLQPLWHRTHLPGYQRPLRCHVCRKIKRNALRDDQDQGVWGKPHFSAPYNEPILLGSTVGILEIIVIFVMKIGFVNGESFKFGCIINYSNVSLYLIDAGYLFKGLWRPLRFFVALLVLRFCLK